MKNNGDHPNRLLIDIGKNLWDMRIGNFRILVSLVMGFVTLQTCPGQTHFSKDTLMRFEASAGDGFHFPFLLYLPKGCSDLHTLTLLVEPNNTGQVSDNFSVHEKAALDQIQHGMGYHIATQLGVPLLVPIFPRPEKDWKIYTHLLDRDAMHVRKGKLMRLDLQLLAMINHARAVLFEMGYVTHQKVWMNGYSSSAVFCNRFATLHPVWVEAYAAGGVNGMIMLPKPELDARAIQYPIGIADFEKMKGEAFDHKAYAQVRQYVYMGEMDSNDAVQFLDGYSSKEQKIIYSLLGKNMMPDRWGKVQEIMSSIQADIVFHAYPQIGHEINSQVLKDVISFFTADSHR